MNHMRSILPRYTPTQAFNGFHMNRGMPSGMGEYFAPNSMQGMGEYFTPSGMGEYFTPNGMGEYYQASAGLGEYYQASAGLGEYFAAMASPGLMGIGALGQANDVMDENGARVGGIAAGVGTGVILAVGVGLLLLGGFLSYQAGKAMSPPGENWGGWGIPGMFFGVPWFGVMGIISNAQKGR